jgi:hypothetical protein
MVAFCRCSKKAKTLVNPVSHLLVLTQRVAKGRKGEEESGWEDLFSGLVF